MAFLPSAFPWVLLLHSSVLDLSACYLSDGLVDCLDPDCCLQATCQNSLLCRGSRDPLDIIQQSHASAAAVKSFYDRIKLLVGKDSTHIIPGENPFNSRWESPLTPAGEKAPSTPAGSSWECDTWSGWLLNGKISASNFIPVLTRGAACRCFISGIDHTEATLLQFVMWPLFYNTGFY